MGEPAGAALDNPDIAAGDTFLGQFIDHDMTLDRTPMPAQQTDPKGLTNFDSPCAGARPSQHSAARCDLNCGDTAAVEHDEPISVSAAQHARIFGERRDDVFNKLVLVGDVGFVVGDVYAVTTDEPDTQHRGRHVVETSPSRATRHRRARRRGSRRPWHGSAEVGQAGPVGDDGLRDASGPRSGTPVAGIGGAAGTGRLLRDEVPDRGDASTMTSARAGQNP
jgi:hypothetical protein